ncbi:DNA topoisomerase [Paenibacillus alvei]|nr:DNA topoisomerase [Paenibacillus alvei]
MGHNIAEALGLLKKGRHFDKLKNGDFVTWAIGHVIQQKEPDSYEEYKGWKLDNLPFIPDPVRTEVDPSKKEQMEAIQDLVKQAKTVVIATDAGREGEFIARLVLKECKYPIHEPGRTMRLWIADLTPESIREAYRNLKDASNYDNLAAAAQVRANADFWMGITATRFFSVLAREVTQEKTTLSAGRVQTPTLRIVYDREMAIQNFVPKPFHVLIGDFQSSNGTYQAQWFKETDEGNISRLETKDEAQAILDLTEGKTGRILSYEEKEVKRLAPQLFDEGSLKKAARKQFGFGLKKSTQLLQAVYEKRYCTYGRTDSRYLNENAADQLEASLKKLKEKSRYKAWFPEIGSIKEKSRFVDNKKVKEHHAIVATGLNPDDFKNHPKYKLTDDEEKLYALILRHTLAAFYPDGTDKEVEAKIEVEGETFYTKSVDLVEQGWRSILKEGNERKPSAPIPQMIPGEEVVLSKLNLQSGKTSKPKRLADTDLRDAMEFAGKYVDQEKIEEEELLQLKEKGIGTPATRAGIIETLVRQSYISIDKNLVYLTEKGKNFMEMVYNHPISSLELTGNFELKLNEVAEGKRSAAELTQEFKEFTAQILSLEDQLRRQIQAKLKGNTKSLFTNVEEIGLCPKCGKPVIVMKKTYSCSAWKDGCKFAVWKEFRKAKVRQKQAVELLEGEEVLIKVPGSEEKRAYSLFIKLNSEGTIETRYPTVEELSIGDCPYCGKPVVEQEKSYSCSGYREGCKFSIWKQFRKVDLPLRHVKGLLAGKQLMMKGLPKEDGTTYDIVLYIEDGKVETRLPTLDDKSVGDCPSCGQPVIEREKSYGCSGYREGCKFTIWKEFRKVQLTPKLISTLLTGKEALLRDIPMSNGDGKYNLFLQLKDNKIETRLPTAEDFSLGNCPECGKPVTDKETIYGCSGYRDGCKFSVPKLLLGQKISVSTLKKLLKNGQTEVLDGFQGSYGTFSKALRYDKDAKRLVFVHEKEVVG